MYRRFSYLYRYMLLLASLISTQGCVTMMAGTSPTANSSTSALGVPISATPELARGLASFYSSKLIGRPTANGERYNPRALSAAHRSLPFGTYVQVENLSNHKRIVVRINDRGPFSKGRIIDLSARAAREIGLDHQGVCQVSISIACPVDGDCQQYVLS